MPDDASRRQTNSPLPNDYTVQQAKKKSKYKIELPQTQPNVRKWGL